MYIASSFTQATVVDCHMLFSGERMDAPDALEIRHGNDIIELDDGIDQSLLAGIAQWSASPRRGSEGQLLVPASSK